MTFSRTGTSREETAVSSSNNLQHFPLTLAERFRVHHQPAQQITTGRARRLRRLLLQRYELVPTSLRVRTRPGPFRLTPFRRTTAPKEVDKRSTVALASPLSHFFYRAFQEIHNFENRDDFVLI